jgi:hypothetical protein
LACRYQQQVRHQFRHLLVLCLQCRPLWNLLHLLPLMLQRLLLHLLLPLLHSLLHLQQQLLQQPSLLLLYVLL